MASNSSNSESKAPEERVVVEDDLWIVHERVSYTQTYAVRAPTLDAAKEAVRTGDISPVSTSDDWGHDVVEAGRGEDFERERWAFNAVRVNEKGVRVDDEDTTTPAVSA